MNEESDVDGKRIPSNISYPRAGHYAVRQIRALDEKTFNSTEENLGLHILNEQQRIYSIATDLSNSQNCQLLHREPSSFLFWFSGPSRMQMSAFLRY